MTEGSPSPSVPSPPSPTGFRSEELSDEDLRLIAEVELLVERVQDVDSNIAHVAAAQLAELLRTATGTVANIPKPLKYIRPHFAALRRYAESRLEDPSIPSCSPLLFDALSLVSMTLDLNKDEDPHPTLDLKLRGTGPDGDLGEWGHEFLRHLSGDIGSAWTRTVDPKEHSGPTLVHSKESLTRMAEATLSSLIKLHDEPAAVDLVLELDRFDLLLTPDLSLTPVSIRQICVYLAAVAKFLKPRHRRLNALTAAHSLYLRMGDYATATCAALALNRIDLIQDTFAAVEDPLIRRQICLTCDYVRFPFEANKENDDDTTSLISPLFRYTAKQLDSSVPIAPEDVCKDYLVEGRAAEMAFKSFEDSFTNTLVSTFANAGHGKEKFFTDDEPEQRRKKCKASKQMAGTASLGLLHLWDEATGLSMMDFHRYANEPCVRAGALLGMGLVLSGTRSVFNPAEALLLPHVGPSAESHEARLAAILGIGFAKAGTGASATIRDELTCLLVDMTEPIDIATHAALSLSLMLIGTADPDATDAILTRLEDIPPPQNSKESLGGDSSRDPEWVLAVLSLGLLYLNRPEDLNDIKQQVTQKLHGSLTRYLHVTLTACAYAGSGDTDIIQELFAVVTQHIGRHNLQSDGNNASGVEWDDPNAPESPGMASEDLVFSGAEFTEQGYVDPTSVGAADGAEDEEEIDDMWDYRSAAMIGIALVAMGDPITSVLVKRSLLLVLLSREAPGQTGRRGLPLALALLNVSDPQLHAIEHLSRLSHDSDRPTAQASILALGLASAGTNNARTAALLRGLIGFYARAVTGGGSGVFQTIRLAQALLSMGKAHVTLCPHHLSSWSVSNQVALAGLLVLCHCALDMKVMLLNQYPHLVLAAGIAVTPRMLLAIDNKDKPVEVQVRVGTAVDTVAVPGKPKTLTGFQTHTSPVLLGATDKAELVPGKYRALAANPEGITIVIEKMEQMEDPAS